MPWEVLGGLLSSLSLLTSLPLIWGMKSSCHGNSVGGWQLAEVSLTLSSLSKQWGKGEQRNTWPIAFPLCRPPFNRMIQLIDIFKWMSDPLKVPPPPPPREAPKGTALGGGGLWGGEQRLIVYSGWKCNATGDQIMTIASQHCNRPTTVELSKIMKAFFSSFLFM